MGKRYIYALGFFDGVHMGHRALLDSCRELAQKTGSHCGAVTFGTHPKTLVRGSAPGLINTPQDRERLLRQLGNLDRVVTLPFDETLRTMPWREFLELLIRDHQAAGFVCGDDFHFGYRGLGKAAALEDFCRERGLPFRMVPQQLCENVRISSTYIRTLLEAGDMERANRFLGHPHVLTGKVVPGKQLGRRLGIPTANLVPESSLVALRHGVYACRCHVDGRSYTAVTNVGNRPTVGGESVTVEPWLLGYEGDLYGRELTLEFHAFLRPEEKFPDLDSLKAAIQTDAQRAKELLG